MDGRPSSETNNSTADPRCCHSSVGSHMTQVLCAAQDPDGFIDNGGWNFLDAEGDGSDEEGDDEEEEGELSSAASCP